MIFSAYPEMSQATAALLKQADEILLKPLGAEVLVHAIRERLAIGATPEPSPVEDVASILEHADPIDHRRLAARGEAGYGCDVWCR